eukprot:CAMPEP_0177598724 /NCGR_PEP_ID=MMETSP0419_2-20121207/12540_1 /TAXON_ID=582737 /ORGANISM="Tetraselmis sp., Strain GSL018" /LENGTH=99 /DNA_ID=CAMNT_0019091265 /DNA_START=414 /DNA_END=714 /DNA_ORIENTATION=+
MRIKQITGRRRTREQEPRVGGCDKASGARCNVPKKGVGGPQAGGDPAALAAAAQGACLCKSVDKTDHRAEEDGEQEQREGGGGGQQWGDTTKPPFRSAM